MFEHYENLEEFLNLDKSKVIVDYCDWERLVYFYDRDLGYHCINPISLIRDLALKYIIDTERYNEFERCLKEIEKMDGLL